MFRHDINGLRAIAVVAVVLYHFNFPGFRGGFAGVDVFFVISGFLMTGIIIRRQEANRFTVLGFYADRARRIVPALLAVCLALVVLGYFIAEPMTYRRIGEHVAASLLFVSNYDYMQSAGYFDSPPETKWLLHTWSLSVEWQFYLLYPIALVVLARLKSSRRWILAVLILGAVLSFGLDLWAYPRKPALSFYSLPTRAWEMFVGGAVVFLPPLRKRLGGGLHLAGLGLILGAIAMINPATPWPGIWTLVPVAGAALVIWANLDHIIWARVAPISALGRWSYSIYLWHWPVLAILSYFEITLAPLLAASVICGVLLLSAASYRFIEDPARRWLSEPRSAHLRYMPLGAVTALAMGIGVGVFLTNGAIGRMVSPGQEAAYQAASDSETYPPSCGIRLSTRELRPCHLGNGATRIAVIGDSHAAELYARYAGTLPAGVEVDFYTQNGCPPLHDVVVKSSGLHCSFNAPAILKAVKEGGYQRVLLAALWEVYYPPAGSIHSATEAPLCADTGSKCVSATDPTSAQLQRRQMFERMAGKLNALSASGVQIAFLLDHPHPDADPNLRASRAAFFGKEVDGAYPLAPFQARSAEVDAEIRRVAAELGGQVIDVSSGLCASGECPFTDSEQRLLYKDGNHLTAQAVRMARFDSLDRFVAGGS